MSMNQRLDVGRDMTADEAHAGYENAVDELEDAEQTMRDTEARPVNDEPDELAS